MLTGALAALLALAPCTVALAATGVPATRAAKPAVAMRTATAASQRSSVTRSRALADTSARNRPRVAPRTLDDIHIEGEIPVPQVLFITAREQRRILGFQHHRYARTSLELGEATPALSGAVVTRPAPVPRKETPR
jgi:hypothetical protein